MSEDKRKSARTQGRYSGSDNEFNSKGQDKKQRGSRTASSAEKNKDEKRNPSRGFGSKTACDIDLQYEEKSDYSFDEVFINFGERSFRRLEFIFLFKALKPARKPQELRFNGEKVLSQTENGTSRILYDENFMPMAEADEYLTVLIHTTVWHEKNSIIRGEKYRQPRLVSWYGPYPYSYAGSTLEARPMPKVILEIKQKVEEWLRRVDISVELNSVLLNWYRNEKDSVDWHSDDELSLGIHPTIASVSLGATRKFLMRPKHFRADIEETLCVNLTHGSLIIMDGCMQKDWMHKVPKEFHDKTDRVNLTFRTIYPIDQLPPEMPHVKNIRSSESSSSTVAHQQEHQLDAENFPPLGLQANDKKDRHSHTENGYRSSTYHRKSQKKENLNENIPNDGTTEIEDNSRLSAHDLVMNSPELHTDSNSNGASGGFVCNKSSNKKSPCNFANDKYHSVDRSDLSDQSDSCSPNTSEHKPMEMDSESSNLEIKSVLNVDAPDFVPQVPDSTPLSKFEKYSLYELAKRGCVEGGEDLQSFMEVILNRIREESILFPRDMYEIKTYCDLHDGSLSDRHLKIIVDRICSMILNAYRRANDPKFSRYPSKSYDDDYHGKFKPSHARHHRY